MRLIDADKLYEQLREDEELARNRVLDTESSLPYPNNLNPSYTRYVAQMDERTRLKHMVADAPTIEPERKKGEWIIDRDCEGKSRTITCNLCGHKDFNWYNPNYCENCGADMSGGAYDG